VLSLLALLVLVATAQAWATPGRFGADPVMLSPQENVRLELATAWVEHGRPSRDLVLPPGLAPDVARAVTPRDAALQDGHVVPKDFPGAVALTALLVRVDPRLAVALSTLSALALLLVVARLARRLGGGRWSGPAAAAVVATTTAFTAGTGGPLNSSATGAAAVVAAVLLLLPAPTASPRLGVSARDVLAGVLLGAGANLRHDLVLLAAGLAAPLVLPPRGSVGRLARVAAGALCAVVPGLLYYAWLHGSPFRTGYALGADELAVPGEPHFDLLTLNAQRLLEHGALYVARPEVVLLLGAAALAARGRRSVPARSLTAGLLLGATGYLVFVGARPLYGVDEFTLGASFLRYALPVVALLGCLATASGGSEPAGRRRARVALLTTSALLGLLLAVQAPGGLLDQRRQVQASAELRDRVLRHTEQDALVVTGRGDKVLWPHRRTITAAYLLRTPADGLRYGTIMYDVVPTPRRLAEVLAGLQPAGSPVYLLADALPPSREGLDLELRLVGLRRSPTRAPGLFAVTAASP
jgi:hypothetical protein